MDCFCGCETRLPARLVEANLLASRLALELLAWDKARCEGRLGDAAELEGLIDRGANAYRRLVLVLHGEERADRCAEAEAWLAESFQSRLDRDDMTDRGGLLNRPKLRLTGGDEALLDRHHPERSFSRRRVAAPAADDVAGQLERLGALHSEGALTDEEFAAAKGRVVRRA